MSRVRSAVALALVLSLSGCQAYHTRYWSWPLNSMQAVENAALNPGWTFRRAVGAELLFNLFPYYWILSAVDLVLLPFTLPHDAYVAAADGGDEGKGFEKQVEEERERHESADVRRKGLGDPRLPTHVPSPKPASGLEDR